MKSSEIKKATSKSNTKRLTEREIEKLPHSAAVALAARCAMRAFPAIGSQGHFSEFQNKEDAKKHVCSIEAAFLTALSSSIGKPELHVSGLANRLAGNAVTAYAAHTTNARHAANAAAAARDAAYAAIASTAAARDAAHAANANASAAIRDAVDARDAANSAARADYLWLLDSPLQKRLRPEFVHIEFFSCPLWANGEIPERWKTLLERFYRALASVGLEEVFYRYEKMLQGKFDFREAGQVVEEWYRDYGPTAEKKSGIREDSRQKKAKVEPIPAPSNLKEVGSSFQESIGLSAGPPTASYGYNASAIETGFAPSSLGDAPSEKDHLGRERLARVLAAMFSSPLQGTPFTVAILGDWGSGKSTLMNLLIEQIRVLPSNFDFKIAKFNAWQYEHSDSIRAGLAHEVVKGLTCEAFSEGKREESWFERTIEYAKLGGKRVSFSLKLIWLERKGWLITKIAGLTSLLVGAAAITYFGITTGDWNVATASTVTGVGALAIAFTVLKHFKTILEHPFSTELFTYLKLPNYGEHMGQLPVIRSQLHNLCDICLKQENGREKRLVVFIDDLDRCGQASIAETLDAIRLVVDIQNVIVVLMIDHRIALRAVAEQYEKLADSQTSKYAIARDYLGKIIQVPIRLSNPHPDHLGKFIDDALFSSVEESEVGKLEQPVETIAPETTKRAAAAKQETSDIVPTESQNTPVSPPEINDVQQPLDFSLSPKIEAEQETIQEDMKDTKADRDLFKTLVRDFKMSNPRQLIRLRNSFRVLKGIHRTHPDQPIESGESQQILTMLFWLEFLYNLASKDRKACEDELLEVNSTKFEGDEKLKSIVAKAKEHFTTAFDESVLEDKGSEGLQSMKNFVNHLVLPFYDFVEEQKVKAEDAKAIRSVESKSGGE